MKQIYLLFAMLGAVAPYMLFFGYVAEQGFSVSEFVNALFANGAVGGFTSDLLISSLVFWLFMFHQRSRERGPNPALFILLNLAIGLSCALPAYLYAREKPQGPEE